MQTHKIHKLNKKFVQSQDNHNLNNSSISGEKSHLLNGQKRLIFDKNKRGFRANGLSLLPLALRPLLLLPIFLSIFIFQTTKVSAASLTLTIPNGISLNVTPEANAKFSKSSASTLSVKSDANFGYTLSIKSKSSTNDLTNGSSKITSISSAVSESDFSSKGSNNTWGYLPSKLNSAANSNFQPGPSTSDTILDKTPSSNTSSNNNYNITLATKTDNTLIAGTYKNTFILTASANTVSYSITYNLNSGSWSGTSPQSGNTTNSTITLDSHSPTKSGYTFKGWCSSSSISNNNTTSIPSCSGNTYQPSGTYNLTNGTNSLSLYAMWQQNVTVTYRSYTIRYHSNIGSPSNMPSTQTGSAASTSSYKITLSSNTPRLSDYTFKGWCTSYTSSASCSGTTYRPSGSVTISSNGQVLDLYAIWDSCSGVIPAYPNATFGNTRWTTTSVTCKWENAKEVCPSGYHLPSKTEFESLISSVGSGDQLYQAGWTDGYYWSSTEYGSSHAYSLSINTGSVQFYYSYPTFNYHVRCVAN